MGVLRPATEEEAAAAFVRAELEWPRFREEILAGTRGWRIGGLFDGLPDDLDWHRVALVPDEVLALRYIDWDCRAALPRDPRIESPSMLLDEIVRELDAYFRIPEVRNDAPWGEFADKLGAPYWREYAEPAWEGRWNGLMVRGADEVERAVTCVFPSDRIVAALEPSTFLFSEHPLDYGDVPGFVPLARESFETMRERGISFYHAHGPLDMHPEVSPSRLCAAGVGLERLEEYYPIADGIPGGAAIVGESRLTIEGLAEALRGFLGPEIKVHVLTRPRQVAGRVAMVAGGGADRDILAASIERGVETYVTGNAATNCRLDWVQEKVREFRELAEEASVALVDAMHYGMEKPPQIAMVAWFTRLGLVAEFMPDGPK